MMGKMNRTGENGSSSRAVLTGGIVNVTIKSMSEIESTHPMDESGLNQFDK